MPLPYTGVFVTIGWWLDTLGAPELEVVLLVAWHLKNSGCRPVKGGLPCKGGLLTELPREIQRVRR